MKHQNQSLRNLLLAAMFLAIGLVLPFFTGQIKEIGNMLLPMHLPVFLCALICGWQYGTAVGFIMPLLRFALFSMPRMPTALAMAFEMATYAFVAGFLYSRARWQCTRMLYRCLIVAMIAGRVVWAAAMIVLLGLSGGALPGRCLFPAHSSMPFPVLFCNWCLSRLSWWRWTVPSWCRSAAVKKIPTLIVRKQYDL